MRPGVWPGSGNGRLGIQSERRSGEAVRTSLADVEQTYPACSLNVWTSYPMTPKIEEECCTRLRKRVALAVG